MEVIRREYGGAVQHDALDAGIGAEPETDLLPQPARQTVSPDSEEGHGDIGHGTGLTHEEFPPQGGGIDEPAHEGKAGGKTDQEPDEMFDRLDPELGEIHGCLVELTAGGRLALQLLLDPGEGVGPDRLEAKISAPNPPRQGRHHGQQNGKKQEQE